MSSIISKHNKKILCNVPDHAREQRNPRSTLNVNTDQPPTSSSQPSNQAPRHAAINRPSEVPASVPCLPRQQTAVQEVRLPSSQMSGPITRQRSRAALRLESDPMQGNMARQQLGPVPDQVEGSPSQLGTNQTPNQPMVPATHSVPNHTVTRSSDQVTHPTVAQPPSQPVGTPPSGTALCNCRQQVSCPLQGRCQEKALIYKATVTSASGVMSYIGSTALPFKERHASHKSSFTHRHLASSTSLSGYVWELKDQGLSPEIKWEILKRSSPYTCGMRKCDLCLTEKLFILRADPAQVLNRHSELMQKCRHTNKFKLMKIV